MGGRTVTSSKTTTNDAPLRAGWYADPESALDERWWNGSQWTSHTRRADSCVGVTGTSDLPPLAWSTASGPLATVQHEEPVGTTSYPAMDAGDRWPQVPTPLAIPPGWYPDPTGVPAQRWWDGSGWSTHTAPQPRPHYGYPGYGGVPYPSTTVVSMAPPKSVGVAFLLTFLFGPLGMLYSTVSGALIMLGISVVGGLFVGIVTLGLAWLVWGPAMWLTSIIWGCAAAANQQATGVITAYR